MKLSEDQEKSIAEQGCPLCGQQKTKRCQTTSGRFIRQPHPARVDQWKAISDRKAKKHARRPIGHGDMTDEQLITRYSIPTQATSSECSPSYDQPVITSENDIFAV